ncbi:MAG: glycosyltransferase family 9 protein [Bacteroidota bacterium]
MKHANELVKKILLVRTDRIGDVVLSLPMLPLIKKKFPNASITVMVRPYTKELVERHSLVDEIILWDESLSVAHYVSLLRAKEFDIAILPYPRFNLSLIIFLAGIPLRVGTGYRWYSFLFNKRIFEHRKDAKRHEVEYNINLLSTIGIFPDVEPQFEFSISAESERNVNSVLSADGVSNFAVLHAGSGGSARDWSIKHFAQLGDVLQSQLQLQVVLTGGSNELQLTTSLAAMMNHPPLNYTGKFSLQELGALFKKARVFVSNSTGPLHIAAMVGTPVVAFYPPILQCSPARWGPYTDKKKVFAADNTQCTLCKGTPCRSNVCMEQITVEQVVLGIRGLLNEKN